MTGENFKKGILEWSCYHVRQMDGGTNNHVLPPPPFGHHWLQMIMLHCLANQCCGECSARSSQHVNVMVVLRVIFCNILIHTNYLGQKKKVVGRICTMLDSHVLQNVMGVSVLSA